MRGSCDGLVIKESEYGENDKLLLVLTNQGKIFITAKGARSPRSKMLSLCRLFTYANFEYYEKNGRKWLSGGEVSDNFYKINSDIEGFALASYILQLVSEITGEGAECEAELRMTLNTLYAIENRIKPLWIIKSAYEMFAARQSGFFPDVSGCARCSGQSCETGWWLDVMNGRILCADCLSRISSDAPIPETDRLMTRNILLPMDDSSVAAWRYIENAPLKKIFSFFVSKDESASRLERSSEEYIINHLERGFETLEFYHAVKE